jgi:hypothetical protein
MVTTDDVAGVAPGVPVSRPRKLVGYALLLLVPLALTTGLLVLVAMTSAAATGGCGGG